MKDNSSAIFIPARLNSSRFPRKILESINGKPLIIHVLDRARDIGICDCYVACCSMEVKEIVEHHGGTAIVTDPELPSGTDRIFAALETLPTKPEYVINLQGDTPVFDGEIIKSILKVLKDHPEVDMTTPVALQTDLTEFNNENVVKVVFNNMDANQPGRAIYFSRGSIPNGIEHFYSHIGIYAYRYDSLKKFVNLPQSFLEKTERLEQLRAIQNGMNVWAVPVNGTALCVDTRDDLKAIYEALRL